MWSSGRARPPASLPANASSPLLLCYHRAVAERRLPFAVRDDEGVQRRGELVIVPAWRDDIRPSPDAAFTIVLAQQPLTNGARVDVPALALCVPASNTRLATTAGEGRVAYKTNGGRDAPPLRLPQSALDAYSGGMLLAARPLAITASEVFAGGRLDDLARALLHEARGDDRYWQSLDAALSWPEAPSRLSRPSAIRVRLRQLLKPVSHDATFASGAFDRLRAIASGGAPQEAAASPGALAEDAAFVRCLPAQAAAAAELARMRAYVDEAAPASHQHDLVVDHASTRERLSFVTLLSEPHSLPGMRAAFETFRSEYSDAYARHHDAYRRAITKLRVALDDARPVSLALARLNTLTGLGRPLGRQPLKEYERLADSAAPCARTDLDAALREQPRCPACGIAMDAEPPREQAEDLVRRLRRALDRQQSRLASEAIRRILARGGERIEQFLQIAQAADQAGLVRVLDDELLAFLQDLLAQPVSITPDALHLMDSLARAHPIVHAADVDAVVETARALLRDRLGAKGEVRLASPPP